MRGQKESTKSEKHAQIGQKELTLKRTVTCWRKRTSEIWKALGLSLSGGAGPSAADDGDVSVDLAGPGELAVGHDGAA